MTRLRGRSRAAKAREGPLLRVLKRQVRCRFRGVYSCFNLHMDKHQTGRADLLVSQPGGAAAPPCHPMHQCCFDLLWRLANLPQQDPGVGPTIWCPTNLAQQIPSTVGAALQDKNNWRKSAARSRSIE
jgi:hypothetical protein